MRTEWVRTLALVTAVVALLFVDDGLPGVDALRPAPHAWWPTAVGRRMAGQQFVAALTTIAPAIGVLAAYPGAAAARPEGVNRPELLPKKNADGSTPKVFNVEGISFLTKGQVKRLDALATDVEKRTGYKIRVLCQSYPQTPGLAVKDFWGVDDKTVVLIADKGLKGTSNILNFNVGDGLADVLPTPFWTRLQGRFGTSRYWRDNGEDVAITNAIESIAYCLGLEDGCTDPPSRDLIDAKL